MKMFKRLFKRQVTAPMTTAEKNKVRAAAASSIMMGTSIFGMCAQSIASMVNTIGMLGFGVLMFVGAFQLVTGIMAFAKSMTGDDDQGADQNGISKGIKKAIAGLIMVLGPFVFLGLLDANAAGIKATPFNLGDYFFNGL